MINLTKAKKRNNSFPDYFFLPLSNLITTDIPVHIIVIVEHLNVVTFLF